MSYEFIVGIDLAKTTFDYTLLKKVEIILQEYIEKTKTALKPGSIIFGKL